MTAGKGHPGLVSNGGVQWEWAGPVLSAPLQRQAHALMVMYLWWPSETMQEGGLTPDLVASKQSSRHLGAAFSLCPPLPETLPGSQCVGKSFRAWSRQREPSSLCTSCRP